MLKVNELEDQLKEGKLASLYLLYGEEKFLLEQSLKNIKKNFGELIQGINYIYIDDTNISNIISDLETPAFGFAKKLIIVRNSGLLKKEGKRKNLDQEKLQIKIEDYIKNNLDIINESIVLVIVEDDIGKNKLVEVIEKNGVVCKFEFQTAQTLQVRLKKICNAYKVSIDTSTLQYFLESCGTNMQELINEIRKLIEYVGPNGTIDNKAIDKLCIKKIESVIFDLTDNLGKKNTKQALDVLNNMIYNKEPIQVIFITLYRHFKKLYIIKLAIDEKKDIAEALSLKPNQMFLINKYKTQSGSFQKNELKMILNEMQELDFKSKIGLIDLNIGLESILCTYCSK